MTYCIFIFNVRFLFINKKITKQYIIMSKLLVGFIVLSSVFLIWAFTVTVLLATNKKDNNNNNNNDDDDNNTITVFKTTPATNSFVLKCMSLNILTTGKDGPSEDTGKWQFRYRYITKFINTSNFDIIGLQEVAKFSASIPNPTAWLEAEFSTEYEIIGDFRAGSEDIEKNPILVKKSLAKAITDSGTVNFDTGDAGNDYNRIFTWVKFTVDNGVDVLFINTQMHKNNNIDAQKLDIIQLADFINANNDDRTRQTIVCGDFNIAVGVYVAYEDLAQKTGLIFSLGFQSGTSGTRPKQFDEDPGNKTQYTTTTTADEGEFGLNAGDAFDVFVYSPAPLKCALNEPNRYMRAFSNNSREFYSLSDHDSVCATFVM
jgi:endonuclease/exonuclease/phosphatase family metal-dependent hydrolase